MGKNIFYSSLLCVFFLQSALSQPLETSSPNGILQVSFTLENGAPHYSVTRFGREVIKPSKLGFILKNGNSLEGDFTIASSDKQLIDETWTQPWGEKNDIRNHYNELRVNLTKESSRKMTVVFRVFDDGIGFRYEIPEHGFDRAPHRLRDYHMSFGRRMGSILLV